jgi:hypothetical protein
LLPLCRADTGLQSKREQGAKPQAVQAYGKAKQRSYIFDCETVSPAQHTRPDQGA